MMMSFSIRLVLMLVAATIALAQRQPDPIIDDLQEFLQSKLEQIDPRMSSFDLYGFALNSLYDEDDDESLSYLKATTTSTSNNNDSSDSSATTDDENAAADPENEAERTIKTVKRKKAITKLLRMSSKKKSEKTKSLSHKKYKSSSSSKFKSKSSKSKLKRN